MDTMTHEMFYQMFASFIRVRPNWARFLQETTIRLRVVSTMSALEGLYLPWYLSPKGEARAYKDIDAQPLAAIGCRRILPEFTAERRKFIEQTAELFASNRGPIQLMIPSYRIDDTRRVAMDGSNRLTAFDMVRPDRFRILEVVASGPLDYDILGDLHYWQHRHK